MSRRTINQKARLGLNDTHFPVEHPGAVALMVKVAEHIKPGLTYHKGDILDCQAFSSHDGKILREFCGYNFKRDEVDPAMAWLAAIQKHTHSLVCLGGNHEYRIERALISQGMQGEALSDYFSIEQCFLQDSKIDSNRFQYVPYVPGSDAFQYFELSPELEHSSRLVVVHGWSYAENAAAVHLAAAHSCSILYGHTHREEQKSIRDPFTKKTLRAANSGTLSRLQPLYRHGKPTTWTLGFDLIYIGSQSWTYYPIDVIETREGGAMCVLPDGKELRV